MVTRFSCTWFLAAAARRIASSFSRTLLRSVLICTRSRAKVGLAASATSPSGPIQRLISASKWGKVLMLNARSANRDSTGSLARALTKGATACSLCSRRKARKRRVARNVSTISRNCSASSMLPSRARSKAERTSCKPPNGTLPHASNRLTASLVSCCHSLMVRISLTGTWCPVRSLPKLHVQSSARRSRIL